MSISSLLDAVLDVLKTDARLISEDGELLKNKIQELAYSTDPSLISLLLKNPLTKERFFREIEGCLIFTQDAFVSFVMSKEFLPDSYTAYKNKIGLNIDGKTLDERKEVSLVWAYKDCVLAGGQDKEDAKRDEIFYNETLGSDQIDRLLDPKVFTEFKRIDKDGKHDLESFRKDEQGNIQDNLIIKGNNLLALHSLKKKFKGQVKLIYIDVPFNTESDSFKYNDKFNHSTWLTFMKNRLEIASDLLRKDGLVFIHCDDNEQAYLKVLADSVFSRDTFMVSVAVKSSTPSGTKTAHKDKKLIKQKDLILVYKGEGEIQLNPQYKAREDWDTHYSLFLEKHGEKYITRKLIDVLQEQGFGYTKLDEIDPRNEKIRKFYVQNSDFIVRLQSHKNKEIETLSRENYKDEFYEDIQNGEIYGVYYNGQVVTKLTRGIKKVIVGKKANDYWSMLLCDFWDDIDFQNTQNEGGIDMPNGKKPEALLARILNLSTQEGDIVLDFFGGSGTTGAVAHKMKRQYILTEQMDYIHDLPEARLINVINGDKTGISEAVGWEGGGEVVYMEIACDAERYIEMIRDAETTDMLIEIWGELKGKSFVNYKLDLKSIDNTLDTFRTLSLEEQKRILIDTIDKNALYKNLSEIDDANSGVSEADKRLNHDFYN